MLSYNMKCLLCSNIITTQTKNLNSIQPEAQFEPRICLDLASSSNLFNKKQHNCRLEIMKFKAADKIYVYHHRIEEHH